MTTRRAAGKSIDTRSYASDRWPSVCALSSVLVLVLLVPLAHSSPPDPSWIAGIYDDADLDDVVIAVTTTSAVVERAPHSADELVFAVETFLEIRATQAGSCDMWQAAECRAPPA
jgi:hypothetical protein